MRVIAIKMLREFWEQSRYADSENALKAWYYEARKAVWNTTQDIKDRYRNASFVGDNRVVFNIHGNKYRLVVHVHFLRGIVRIKFVGTHRQYDEINVETI